MGAGGRCGRKGKCVMYTKLGGGRGAGAAVAGCGKNCGKVDKSLGERGERAVDNPVENVHNYL